MEKLQVKYFNDCAELVRFVNSKGIKRHNIQVISQLNGNNWTLIYWALP